MIIIMTEAAFPKTKVDIPVLCRPVSPVWWPPLRVASVGADVRHKPADYSDYTAAVGLSSAPWPQYTLCSTLFLSWVFTVDKSCKFQSNVIVVSGIVGENSSERVYASFVWCSMQSSQWNK